MEPLCRLLGWVCKACMMAAILRLGAVMAVALGLGARMIPMVTRICNYASDQCSPMNRSLSTLTKLLVVVYKLCCTIATLSGQYTAIYQLWLSWFLLFFLIRKFVITPYCTRRCCVLICCA